MSFEYIQRAYGVQAHKGRRVEYTGGGDAVSGTIVGEAGAHIMIRFDGDDFDSGPFHPTWALTYHGVAQPARVHIEEGDHEIPF